MKTYSTRGLFLGKPEAEAEKKEMITLFEDYFNIEQAIERGAFIITGRKGAGKSAYAVWLQEKAKNNDNLFCSLVKKNDSILEELINMAPEHKLSTSVLFEWIILVRLTQMIIQTGQGKYNRYANAIEEFYDKNAGYININAQEVKELYESKEFNIAPLMKEFVKLHKKSGISSYKAPFYKMLLPLRTIIVEALKMDCYQNINFFVLFDDLDVKFKLDRDKETLMDLIRVARIYNTEYFSDISAHVLLFLRDDIGDKLDGVDSDKNKIFLSYEHGINWYEHQEAIVDERNILLRKFINHRLSLAFERLGIPYEKEDPWLTFVRENEYGKTLFKVVLDYTFYLPRDLIMIFMNLGSHTWNLPITYENIQTLLTEYSSHKKSEIYDELCAIWETEYVDKIFKFLKEVLSDIYEFKEEKGISYDEVLRKLEEHNLPETVFQLLLDYTLLVPVDDKGNVYFNYREKEVFQSFEMYHYKLPAILSRYFNRRT